MICLIKNYYKIKESRVYQQFICNSKEQKNQKNHPTITYKKKRLLRSMSRYKVGCWQTSFIGNTERY